MKTIWQLTTFVAALTVVTLTGQSPLQAEDLSYTDLLSRITTLESELQKTQDVQLASCTSEASCGFSTSCRPNPCESPSWYYGYELTTLRPYVSEAFFGTGTFDGEFGYGHRLTWGYDGGSGLGARMRYWLYNHAHDSVPPSTLGIDMDVIDFELNLTEQLRNYNVMLSGGARYARMELTGLVLPTFVFEGGGPTAAVEATREFGDRGLYLIGNVRGSLLFGDLTFPGQKIADETTVVLENQLGFGMTHCLGNATLNLRTVWETQTWMGETMVDFYGSRLSFGGPSTSIELRY